MEPLSYSIETSENYRAGSVIFELGTKKMSLIGPHRKEKHVKIYFQNGKMILKETVQYYKKEPETFWVFEDRFEKDFGCLLKHLPEDLQDSIIYNINEFRRI